MEINKITYLNWTTVKPIFDNKSKECLLLTATKYEAECSYTLFEMKKIDFEENWYWGILNENGDEWGDYVEDLEADLYCILPYLEAKNLSVCDHIKDSDGMICRGGRCFKCGEII